MRVVVGVTDNRWARHLRDRPDLTEANFWQPSPHGFKALSPGEPFLFKTKDPKKFRDVDIPGYALVGGGFFDEYVELRVSEAWTIWGEAKRGGRRVGAGCSSPCLPIPERWHARSRPDDRLRRTPQHLLR